VIEHEKLRMGKTLSYYLEARKIAEKIFGNELKPRLWECYRSLWYSTYNGKKIKDYDLQTFTRGY
jgi:hypothetical protein